MKKMLALSLALLPVFMHADGVIAWGVASSMDKESNKAVIPSFHEYHNRMAVFGPLHQVYERTETDAFYVGVETWLVGAVGSRKSCAIGEAELRFGYNLFYNGRDHLTPFAGGGFIKAFHHKRHEIPTIGYGVVGLLYDHEFNSIFTLGTNFKVMGGGVASHKTHHWGNYAVGFDLSIPITFRFGNKRHWDYRIEPFNIYLHGKNSNVYYFGGRSTLGYRF